MSKKDIRQKFRNSVFSRDNWICQVCGGSRFENDLDAHHITDRSLMENGGYVDSNGISVCKEECHMKVEKFHMTNGKNWINGLHPNDLYLKIKSSKEKADLDSKNLK